MTILCWFNNPIKGLVKWKKALFELTTIITVSMYSHRYIIYFIDLNFQSFEKLQSTVNNGDTRSVKASKYYLSKHTFSKRHSIGLTMTYHTARLFLAVNKHKLGNSLRYIPKSLVI